VEIPMQVDTNELRQALIKIKEQIISTLDRAKQNKVKSALLAQVGVIETILIWLSNQEKQEEIKMDTLKLGELVKWEPKKRTGSIDSLIIEESKKLKKNFDAIKVTVDKVKWNTLSNRTYKLRETNQIPINIVPRKDENGVPHLVFLDEPAPQRSKRS
jgi:hypothetical protein